MINTNSLIYFLHARKTASFSRTAQFFSVSVPAISSSIKKLESILSFSLFLRTKHRLLPANGSDKAASFALLLLSGLKHIEGASKAGNIPEELLQTDENIENQMLLDEQLDAFLLDCQKLKLTPLLLLRFLTVYERGSIRNAAANLGITQPQISRQISYLEKILQIRLFERESNGLVPTSAAHDLYKVALELHAVCEQVIHRGDLLFRKEMQTTHLGSVPPISTDSALCILLSKICEQWDQIPPAGHIRITTGLTDALLTKLLNNELHAAIIDTCRIPEGFDEFEIGNSPFVLTIGQPYPMESTEALDTDSVLSIINKHPFVQLSNHSSLRELTDEWMHAVGACPERIVEIDSMTVIANLIAKHGYVALLPNGVFSSSDGVHHTIPVPDAPILRQRLIWKHEMSHSRHIKRLLNMLENDGN